MHIHLDAIGGISGNMFVGAMLSCFPELEAQLQNQITLAGFPELVTLNTEEKNDGVLRGVYFSVVASKKEKTGDHHHRHYADIRDRIGQSDLEESVKSHVLGIFLCLAEAEADVHGKDVESVAFHEVGAWDSIADIVCAGYLIAASGAESWSVSSLPTGNGQVKTAHGMLPLPAPAVTCLLHGYVFHDDGLEGERVTPTGAAILKYLDAGNGIKPTGAILAASGFGFGSHAFPGISNVLRAMVLGKSEEQSPWQEEQVLELAFEVDDQSAEDLAVALENIRRMAGVLDVMTYPGNGKKLRLSVSVRILLEPASEQEVLAACFNQTATLGVRRETVHRAVLPRMDMAVEVEGKQYTAKVTQRPSGELTAKASMDELAFDKLSLAERQWLRQEIEARAIETLLDRQDDE